MNLRLYIEQKTDKDNAEMAGDLAFLFENVAKLPVKKEAAMKLYEQYVQKAVRIIGLPIVPKIEKDTHSDQSVWNFIIIS